MEIISTGGTASLLREEGVKVRRISDFTGFPEMLDGRVKTLHPKVHGGLLYVRGNEEHGPQPREHGIEPIDLVVVNLYPFEETVAKPGVDAGGSDREDRYRRPVDAPQRGEELPAPSRWWSIRRITRRARRNARQRRRRRP